MTISPLVRDYLAALRSTASDRLDPERSDELVEEIREHIEAAITQGQPTEDVLQRLGSPAEIVSAEAPAPMVDPRPADEQRLRPQEIAAVILLLVGLLLAVIGWVVGAVLLWTSSRWSTRDKLIGTLLWPGGLGTILYVGATGTGAGSGVAPWLGVAIAIALTVVPVLTAIHLCRSAKVPTTR